MPLQLPEPCVISHQFRPKCNAKTMPDGNIIWSGQLKVCCAFQRAITTEYYLFRLQTPLRQGFGDFSKLAQREGAHQASKIAEDAGIFAKWFVHTRQTRFACCFGSRKDFLTPLILTLPFFIIVGRLGCRESSRVGRLKSAINEA
jgi:hypothetical protein